MTADATVSPEGRDACAVAQEKAFEEWFAKQLDRGFVEDYWYSRMSDAWSAACAWRAKRDAEIAAKERSDRCRSYDCDCWTEEEIRKDAGL